MGPAVKDARNHNANTNLDAIVVGAGLSGLIAARRLQAKGKRVVVLDDNIKKLDKQLIDYKNQIKNTRPG